jgi:hypothetical protein
MKMMRTQVMIFRAFGSLQPNLRVKGGCSFEWVLCGLELVSLASTKLKTWLICEWKCSEGSLLRQTDEGSLLLIVFDIILSNGV